MNENQIPEHELVAAVPASRPVLVVHDFTRQADEELATAAHVTWTYCVAGGSTTRFLSAAA